MEKSFLTYCKKTHFITLKKSLLKTTFIRNIAKMCKKSLTKIWAIAIVIVLSIALYSTLTIAGFQLSEFMACRNLWKALAAHYQLSSQPMRAPVKQQIHWYTASAANRAYINQLSKNARPYLYYVYAQLRQRNMPSEIALLPMIESNYRPYKYSSTGATGLWQMMPGTASGLGVKFNWWYDGRRDIRESTAAALSDLQNLHKVFHNWLLAIAAYNCGANAVIKAIHFNQRHHLPTDFWSLPLPQQTKVYVPKLLALAKIFQRPMQYHVDVLPIPNEPYFSQINMKQQFSLSQIATLAHTNDATVRDLNPGFRRWSTGPIAQYTLLLPIANADIFKVNINDTNGLHDWQYYHVRRGQSLSVLAEQFHTSVNKLKHLNHLHGDQIYYQQKLRIPNQMHERYARLIKRHHGSISEDHLPGPKAVIHTVHRHETLIAIAQKYRVTPDKIRFWNELGYHEMIKPAQKLIIWQ